MSIFIRERPHLLVARLPVETSVRGRIALAKYDRSGARVPVRVDRGKRAFQRVWDHEQPNLITNAGMNYGINDETAIAPTRFREITTFVAVGTGSTTPAYTDNALANEVARTNTALSLGTEGQYTAVTTGQGRWRRVRTFDFGEANGNLTEFGASDTISNPMYTRALFVDETDTPVAITKTSDEQFAIQYDLISSVSPTTPTAAGTVTYTGLGTFSISTMAYASAAGSTATLGGADNMGPWTWLAAFKVGVAANLSESYETTAPPGTVGVEGVGNRIGGWLLYPGSGFEREATASWPATANDVADVRAIYLGTAHAAAGFDAYFGWGLTSPTNFTKGRDYRLVINATAIFARD